MVIVLEAADETAPFWSQGVLWCVFCQLNPCVTLCSGSLSFWSQLWISTSQLLISACSRQPSFVTYGSPRISKGSDCGETKNTGVLFLWPLQRLVPAIQGVLVGNNVWYRGAKTARHLLFWLIPSTSARSAPRMPQDWFVPVKLPGTNEH